MDNLLRQVIDRAESSFFILQKNGDISFASRGLFGYQAAFFRQHGLDAFDYLLDDTARLKLSIFLDRLQTGGLERRRRLLLSVRQPTTSGRQLLLVGQKIHWHDQEVLLLEGRDHSQESAARRQLRRHQYELDLFRRLAQLQYRYQDESLLYQEMLRLLLAAVPINAILIYGQDGLLAAEGLTAATRPPVLLPAKLLALPRLHYADRPLPAFRRQRFMTQVTVPLKLGDDRVGTLVAISFQVQSFDWRLLRRLRKLGEQVGAIIATRLLARQHLELRSVADNLFAQYSEPLAVIDEKGYFRRRNDGARQLWPPPATYLTQCATAADRPAVERFLRQLLFQTQAELQLNWPAGRSVFRLTGSEIKDSQPRQFLLIAHDVSTFVQEQDRLRRLDSMKDEFIALVSHELNSPLTVLKGNLSLLMPNLESEVAKQLNKNLTRLERLVNDILGVTKLTYEEIDIAVRTVSVRELLQTAFLAVGNAAAKKNLHLKMRCQLDEVESDFDRLLQVVVNLLNNAVQHTDEGGTITVSVTAPEEQRWRLAVTDTGSGINPSSLPHIFERFWRGSSHYAGSGLGLYVVHKLVSRLGGSVKARSTLGKGTTFTVLLPRQLTGEWYTVVNVGQGSSGHSDAVRRRAR